MREAPSYRPRLFNALHAVNCNSEGMCETRAYPSQQSRSRPFAATSNHIIVLDLCPHFSTLS